MSDPQSALTLTNEQTRDIMRLAAVGMSPRDIATALELSFADANIFITAAEIPGTPVARAIASGNISGRSIPQIKLQEAASAGNVEAIREIQRVQARNRFQELLNNMDDDEFAFQTIAD